jgi:RHS repeat-associated protein
VATLLLSNTLALQLAGATGTRITVTVFSVAMPKPVGLGPSPLALTAGTSGTLTATLSPAPTAAGTLNVTSSNTQAATVPASVSFASGQVSVAIPVSARGAGSATITASANGGQASATVNVKGEARVYYIHPDHLNTPRLIADSTGTTVWRWDQQEPFGSTPPNDNPSGLGAFDFPLRLPGQYYDRETTLHYNMMRDYDPSIGRYVESDPIGLDGGLNTYAYVGNSPVDRFDPDGLATCEGIWKLVKWYQDNRLIAKMNLLKTKYPNACRCDWTCIKCDGSPGSDATTNGRQVIKTWPYWQNPWSHTYTTSPWPNACDCDPPGPSSNCQCKG